MNRALEIVAAVGFVVAVVTFLLGCCMLAAGWKSTRSEQRSRHGA